MHHLTHGCANLTLNKRLRLLISAAVLTGVVAISLPATSQSIPNCSAGIDWVWVPACNNTCWCILGQGSACDWVPVCREPVAPTDTRTQTALGLPKCSLPACGGEPINFVNGNVFIQQTDLSVPGLGVG